MMLRWLKSVSRMGRLKTIIRAQGSLRANVFTGKDFSVGQNSSVWAPRSLRIGNNVSLGSNVRIEVDGVIGDCVLIANSVGIVGRTDHRISHVGIPITKADWVGAHPNELSQPVIIGSDVWVGYGATILSGVSIGDSTVIGAGSVVTTDIPANSIAVGVPARVIAKRFDSLAFERHWELLGAAGLQRLLT